MRRRRWLLVTALALGLVAVAGWGYFHQPAVGALDPG